MSIAKDIGLPWAAFLALTYGAYKSGIWLTQSAKQVAEFVGPKVADYLQAQQESMVDTRMRLRTIERGQDNLGRGIRDVHRRLDKSSVPKLSEQETECDNGEDSDEHAEFSPSKSKILKNPPK